MAYHNPQAGPASQPEVFSNFQHPGAAASNFQPGGQAQFDIFEWYPEYQSCHKYFLDHAQHTIPVQALAAFINITLPYQRQPQPVFSSNSASSPSLPLPGQRPQNLHQAQQLANPAHAISLIPYIRRLIATGNDYAGILHGFFGDKWQTGIGPLQEIERRNYLFAAKSGGWASVKAAYDMPPNEFVPFLQPLRNPSEAEVQQAEESWSDWLKMEDWVIGPRSPFQPIREIKTEPGLR